MLKPRLHLGFKIHKDPRTRSLTYTYVATLGIIGKVSVFLRGWAVDQG